MLSSMINPSKSVFRASSRLLYRNSQASFCTSTPRWPRARTLQKLYEKDATQQLYSEAKGGFNSKPIVPTSANQITSHSQPSTPKQEHISHEQDEPSETSPKSSKRSAPPGLKPHIQSLFTSILIRQSPSSTSLTTQPTTLEHKKITAASAFFTQGFQFLYSAEALRHHAKNEHIPEIVVLGASNVGKSSFLNALVGKFDAARVSAKPGKTTLMNAFGVGPLPKIPKGLVRKGEKMPRYSLVVVDTPGYGFRSQASWGDSIIKYIKARKTLRGAVVLLSSEKRLMEQDRWLLRSLAEANTRTLVVLTKADKGGGSWTTTCSAMAETLQEELKTLEKAVGNDWKEGSGWNPDVYITSAGMNRVPKLGNGGGMGGVRAAILDMAGFNLDDKEMKKKDETVTYGGPVVSFDDIKWKT